MFALCGCRRREASAAGVQRQPLLQKSEPEAEGEKPPKLQSSGDEKLPSTGEAKHFPSPGEGSMCPITGLVGICPMAKKAPLQEGERPPELKVLMLLVWEEGESKVSVGVYPHNSPHWEALGLPDTSTSEEIKAQYRKLSVRYHPDKNKEEGAKERFQKITEAYQALKDTDGQLAFPWEKYPERQKVTSGSELVKEFGCLGAEAAASDPIKGQFMQQVVKEATDCKSLIFERETSAPDKTTKETWADALCVDSRSGANHLVKVYRRIVSYSEEALREAKEEMEELED